MLESMRKAEEYLTVQEGAEMVEGNIIDVFTSKETLLRYSGNA